MSMMRCDNCDRFIDTDFDSEHFEECQAVSNLKRDIEEILEPKCLRSGCEIKHRCNPKTATTQIINLIESVIDKVIGKDDRDYSGDNADEESLKILVATSTACNELRKEQRDIKSKLIDTPNKDKDK